MTADKSSLNLNPLELTLRPTEDTRRGTEKYAGTAAGPAPPKFLSPFDDGAPQGDSRPKKKRRSRKKQELDPQRIEQVQRMIAQARGFSGPQRPPEVGQVIPGSP